MSQHPNQKLLLLLPLPFIIPFLKTVIHKGRRGKIQKKTHYIHTLAPGTKTCKILVRGDLQAFNGRYCTIFSLNQNAHTHAMHRILK